MTRTAGRRTGSCVTLTSDETPAGEPANGLAAREAAIAIAEAAPTEVGGRKGPEPTRYGDWERNGIAVDF